jgi:hypothetical protein
MKQTFKKRLESLGISFMDGPINEVIEKIQDLKKVYPNRNLILDFDWDFDGVDYILYEIREETDNEYIIRIEKERLEKEEKAIERLNKQKKKAEEERKKYEELKKKYEEKTN